MSMLKKEEREKTIIALTRDDIFPEETINLIKREKGFNSNSKKNIN